VGLDNGIVANHVALKDIPAFVVLRDKDEPITVAYWRKCWGIRRDILWLLSGNDQDHNTPVEAEDIPAIVRILEKFLSKEYWDENAESIWEFDEYVDNLIQQIINLKWLYSYMQEHPEVECYFYDSY